MNPLRPSFVVTKFLRRVSLVLLPLALVPAAWAQQVPRAPEPKSERVLRAEAKLATLAQPPSAVAGGVDGEAASVVVDTAEGRLDQAQKLLRTGLWLKKKGETALAADAAAKALALAQLDAAGAMIDPAKQPAFAARRNELAGMVHERLTGNAALARQSYEAAKQSSAGSAQLAESRLDRLDTELAKDGKTEKPKG